MSRTCSPADPSVHRRGTRTCRRLEWWMGRPARRRLGEGACVMGFCDGGVGALRWSSPAVAPPSVSAPGGR